MHTFWLSAVLVIAANVGFHLIQKSIPQQSHPLISVIVTYIVAIITCFMLLIVFPATQGFIAELTNLNWASAALGFAIIGIELGYLLMYRYGWNVSMGPIFCYALVTILLIPLGLLFFHEKLALQNYAGIVLTLLGVYLLTWRRA